MRPAALVLLVVSGVRALAQAALPVAAEFRVFAGTQEITDSTRVRLIPTGARHTAALLKEGERHVASVAPGIYDVQALRVRREGIVAIKWAERLSVMHYPDEGGRHLEVINFHPGYGALQVRTGTGSIDEYEVTVFSAGNRTITAGEPFAGDGYRLFVLREGRYDLRVRKAGAEDDAQGTRWLLDIEVPADRTRLRLIDPSFGKVESLGRFGRPQRFDLRERLRNGSPSRDQVHDKEHERDDQQHVHDSTRHVEREAEQPEQQQQDDKRPQHEPSSHDLERQRPCQPRSYRFRFR